MAQIEFEYEPSGPILERFHESNAFVRILEGPLGSAKTTACCVEIFTRSEEQVPDSLGVRKTRWLIVRNTYPELETTTIKSWRGIFDDRFGRFTWSKPPSHLLKFSLPDGTKLEAEIIFMALDDPREAAKIRGMELTGCWFNEVREIPKAVIDMATGRVARYPAMRDGGPTWAGIICDTNMPDDDHWLYDYAENKKPHGWEFYRQPGGVFMKEGRWHINDDAENINNLPKSYYLNQLHGKPEDWIKVYLAAEYGYVQEGRPIYPEFVDSLHISEEPIPPARGLPIGIGIDFGLTPAAVFGQRLASGCINWIDELVTEDMGTVRFAEELRAKLNRDYPDFTYEAWGDPAGDQRAQTDERTPFDILKAAKFDAHKAPTNDPIIRRESVAQPLTRIVDGRPGLLISKKCSVTRKGMAGGYCYRRVQIKGEERYHDKPDKNKFSHPCEAGQYLNLGFGEGRAVLGKSVKKKFSQPEVEQYNPLRR